MKTLDGPSTSRSTHYTKRIIHPAAEISPPLQGEAFDAFVDVMKRYGDVGLDPIVAVRVPEADGHVNGTIALLSGRTNLAACEKLGREPKIAIYSGEQPPAELAVSLQLLHPHLSIDQRAAIGVEIADQIAVEAKERQKAAGGPRKPLLSKVTKALDGQAATPTAAAADDENDPAALHSRTYASRIVNVSAGYIWRAQTVRAHDPKLFAKIKIGALKLGVAFQETKRARKRESMAPLRRNLPDVAPHQVADAIHTGDCLKLLPALPRRKFRLVFADPPYNIGVDYGKGSAADHLPESKYLAWCERWLGELPELLTPDGAAVVLIDQTHLGEFLLMMKRTRLQQRSIITWYETFGGNCTDKFNRTSRYLLYFLRDPKRFVFNHDKLSRPSDRQVKYNDVRANPNGKLLDDVWFDIPRLTGTCAERLPDFPTQLPEQLLRRVIEGLSEPGDNVLDPFCGSGTTAAVCAKTGRHYWSCDVNGDYATAARARVQRILDAAGGKGKR